MEIVKMQTPRIKMNGMMAGVEIFNLLSRTAPVAAGKSMAPEVLLLDYMNMLGKCRPLT